MQASNEKHGIPPYNLSTRIGLPFVTGGD